MLSLSTVKTAVTVTAANVKGGERDSKIFSLVALQPECAVADRPDRNGNGDGDDVRTG